MPNKEQIVSVKKDALTLAIENNPCGRCRVAGYPTCKCGGGSGAGESGSSSSDENKNEDITRLSNQTVNMPGQTTLGTIQQFDKNKTLFVQSELSSNSVISYETEFLSIESDRLRGNLTFKIKEGLSETELKMSRKFLKMVNAEFEVFKDQLGTSARNFTVDLKDNELAVHIPIPKYYDAFIKHLENKNLLPIPNPNQQYKSETQNKSSKLPTPFDAINGPKPKGWKE